MMILMMSRWHDCVGRRQ